MHMRMVKNYKYNYNNNVKVFVSFFYTYLWVFVGLSNFFRDFSKKDKSVTKHYIDI